jgi:hypothetical protein
MRTCGCVSLYWSSRIIYASAPRRKAAEMFQRWKFIDINTHGRWIHTVEICAMCAWIMQYTIDYSISMIDFIMTKGLMSYTIFHIDCVNGPHIFIKRLFCTIYTMHHPQEFSSVTISADLPNDVRNASEALRHWRGTNFPDESLITSNPPFHLVFSSKL